MGADPVVDILPEAVEEGRHTYQWYFERSERAASGFENELRTAFLRITEAPLRWPTGPYATRRCLLPTYPYQVMYRVSPGRILIVAVAHGARKPRYWRRRSSPR